MTSTRYLFISVVLALLIFAAGVSGYMLIEGWNLMDAVYMTVITITTVGFNEVHTLSEAGRIFTIVLVITGVATFLYVAGSLVQFMVEGKIREIMGRRTLAIVLR